VAKPARKSATVASRQEHSSNTAMTRSRERHFVSDPESIREPSFPTLILYQPWTAGKETARVIYRLNGHIQSSLCSAEVYYSWNNTLVTLQLRLCSSTHK